jgi:hypothetical protein
MNSFEWFTKEVAPNLHEYKLDYKFFHAGDFGSLNQVEFNSDRLGGNVDFWELGWLGIFVWDYEGEKEVFNVLIQPHQESEKGNAFKHLQEILL